MHEIFREKWTVAAGRIKFSKCVFAIFIFREIFSENHQNRPNAKSSGLGPDIFAPESAEIALFAKVRGRVYFSHLFAPMSKVGINTVVFTTSREPEMRKSALFAKKCTFGPFGLRGASQNDSNSLGFGARAPLEPILAKKCTFAHFTAKRAPWGPRIAIGLGPTHRIAVGQGSPRLSV